MCVFVFVGRKHALKGAHTAQRKHAHTHTRTEHAKAPLNDCETNTEINDRPNHTGDCVLMRVHRSGVGGGAPSGTFAVRIEISTHTHTYKVAL